MMLRQPYFLNLYQYKEALMIRSCMFRRRYQNLLLHFYIYHIKQHLKH